MYRLAIARIVFALACPVAAAGQQVSLTLAAPNSAIFGQSLTLTATATPPDATGRVTFYDGVDVLGIARLESGQATFATTQLPSGVRDIRAVYGGGNGYPPAVSETLAIAVHAMPSSGFQSPANYAMFPNSLVRGDFNGDAIIDLAVLTSGGMKVLLGNADGTFREALNTTVSFPLYSMVAGDFDGDGKLDLAISTFDAVYVFLGKGDGAFQSPLKSAPARGGARLIAGDFNGDGILDLAMDSPGVPVLFGNGDGTFQPQIQSAPHELGLSAVADFNGDGKADLVTYGRKSFRVWLGNGDGTFEKSAAIPAIYGTPVYAAVGDFNGDGTSDLVLVSSGPPAYTLPATWNTSLYLGQGDGTFQSGVTVVDRADSAATGPLVVADFDGDGNSDLAILNTMALHVNVFLGDGRGAFQERSPVALFTVAANVALLAADFNGDGRTDLAVMGGTGVKILLGDNSSSGGLVHVDPVLRTRDRIEVPR